jgi:hypothetical protein
MPGLAPVFDAFPDTTQRTLSPPITEPFAFEETVCVYDEMPTTLRACTLELCPRCMSLRQKEYWCRYCGADNHHPAFLHTR